MKFIIVSLAIFAVAFAAPKVKRDIGIDLGSGYDYQHHHHHHDDSQGSASNVNNEYLPPQVGAASESIPAVSNDYLPPQQVQNDYLPPVAPQASEVRQQVRPASRPVVQPAPIYVHVAPIPVHHVEYIAQPIHVHQHHYQPAQEVEVAPAASSNQGSFASASASASAGLPSGNNQAYDPNNGGYQY